MAHSGLFWVVWAHFGLFKVSFWIALASCVSPFGSLGLVLGCFDSFWVVFAHFRSLFALFKVVLIHFGSS